jgi:hypothetical protein
MAIATGERGLIAGLDPVALQFLDRMCREHELQVVISSTWRYKQRRRDFYQIFAAGGHIDLAKAIHDKWDTPVLADGTRGEEIERWLLDNDPDAEYIILDDDCDMLEYQKKRFVCTDGYNGMLHEHFIAAEKIIEEGGKLAA